MDILTPRHITFIFLAFLILKRLTESLLDQKNKAHILYHRDRVPEEFHEKIKLEEHQKAADYSVAKIKTGRFFGVFNLAFFLLWTLGGGLQYLDEWVSTLSLSPLFHGVVFFSFFGLISILLGIPESLYSTFVIEERFGFNKMTLKLFLVDLFKGLVLGAVLGLPLVGILLWIMQALGSQWWIYAWAFLTFFQFAMLWAYPRFIAPLFNEFKPLSDGETKERILQLLKKTGFTSKGLFVMNASLRSSHGNAYFTGFGKNKRIVFFDTLINSLNPQEVEAVLAHELGHFKRKHVLKQLIGGMITSFVGFFILSKLIGWAPFFMGHGVLGQELHLALVLFILVSGTYTFFLTPVFSWISRRYEFEADTFAAQNSDPQNLITALIKLYRENASTLTPDPAYSSFYHSHPPALTRINFLQSLKDS